MTVSSTTNKSGPYAGNGVTTNFAVLFKYSAKADVDVIVTSSAGVETTKTLDTHYTLTVPGDTGTVSFITTPTDYRPQTGETVTIVRTIAMVQDMDLTSGGGLSANTVEANADTQLMQIQEIAERVSRAPLLRQTSAAAPITLPEPVALNLLSWNAAGTDLENTVAADLDIGLVSPFILTLLDDVSAAAARTTLGVVIGTNVQAWDAQLDEWATVDPSENGKSLVSAADYAAMRALLDLEAGTDFYSIAAADAAFLSPAEGNAAYQPLDSDLTALAGNSTDGLWAHTGAGTGAARTLTAPGAGFTITNPAGIAGNPTFVLANDLAALEALSTTGFVTRTASETFAQRTITGTANQITVTNGDGVAGAPTLSLPIAPGITTLASGSFAAANTQTIMTSIPATYSSLVLRIAGLSSNTAARHPLIQVSTNNGSSYDTTPGNYLALNIETANVVDTAAEASLIVFADEAAAGTFEGHIKLEAYQGGPNMLFSSIGIETTAPGVYPIPIGVYRGSTNAINAIRMIWNNTGNSDAGTYALYGVA